MALSLETYSVSFTWIVRENKPLEQGWEQLLTASCLSWSSSRDLHFDEVSLSTTSRTQGFEEMPL